MKSYQPSFFDDSERLTALRRLGDPLMELSKYIDFEIFRPKLEEALRKEDRKCQAGRKSLDVIFIFKAIFLKKFYNISDEQLEFQITDRCSFTNFLSLHSGAVALFPKSPTSFLTPLTSTCESIPPCATAPSWWPSASFARAVSA